ncbi:hypothetical protein M3D48_05470 [Dermabacter vaginalis]|uniref:Uncharacterized protein n=1 Tax=Dermabacter vaginalis TaxID=1630135 RepID=A0A1B0ZHL0_9MICO|nr:hypothetical protein [Dermabacter vaginalis]ANP27421.1 hypothetical protein DAD186_08710 [Dermabacter vaginalis]MCG7443110.1 hypothetical protein [Dermabacter vaginalis]MCT2150069.1 hypothetical protein [Dermabacter vaginalis]SHW52708.1 Uncharacterised protein [Mycobacteroides abscessus subsp. abscessus]
MGNIDWAFELGALLPSIGIGLLFWFVLRSILRADKHQREAEREAEREYIAAHPEAARFVRTKQTANAEKRKDATTSK